MLGFFIYICHCCFEEKKFILDFYLKHPTTHVTAVQPVFNLFSQFVPQLELFSQLSLLSDPMALSVAKSTW